jgi:glycerophosphoryl diester phosphodiesterase
MRPPFDIQGHRGARGLRPENTLPSFEIALDLGVTSVETDVHLTRDGHPVLVHDPIMAAPVFRPADRSPMPTGLLAISQMTLAEVQSFAAGGNPSRERFPEQVAEISPLAERWALKTGLSPWAPPTLANLFDFVAAYTSDPSKSLVQQALARALRFDIELKRVPSHPEAIGDAYDGTSAALLEWQIVAAIQSAAVAERTTVRSFDHRCVEFLRKLEPRLEGAILVGSMVPVDPVALARLADASVYCPHYEFVDEALVRRCHEGGIKIIPWTVNDFHDMGRLLDWGVDGITTDHPERLVAASLKTCRS